MCVMMMGYKISAQSKMSIAQLKQRIIDSLDQEKGIFAVAFKDLSTGKVLFINEHELFHAASTMKTPVLIELFKQSTAKKFSLSDSITIKNEFKSIVDSSVFKLDSADDGETDLYKHIGEKQSISNLAYRMITLSSNLSTNLLIELVNAKNVTQTMRDMGAKDIQVLRGVEDNKAYEKGLNNMVTAFDLMIIYEALATGKAVNDGASEAMIRILLDQKFNEVIPGRLPKNVKVAHKTGSFKTVHHDSGIVFLPNGKKYVLVLLSKNLEDDDAAVKMMAGVSEVVYEYELLIDSK
ncbi:MAG: serine hydrolase [Bacteroidetes bacterium]|nr:serine hydrolase [Bacteroidota bacterium]